MAFAGNHHTGFPCLLDLDPYKGCLETGGSLYFSKPQVFILLIQTLLRMSLFLFGWNLIVAGVVKS